MAISESQLETWSKLGKAAQFTNTYNAIRYNLLDPAAPYPVGLVDVHLQGSYGNDTNVWSDSDVDVVLCHTGAFYYDLSNMASPDQVLLQSSLSGEVAYRYENFQDDAKRYIASLYRDVDLSGKAIFVPGNDGRRSADVLVCQQFRRYYSLNDYRSGIAFMRNGARIENFPKQHSANCTTKHQATSQNFKQMVRIFKNVRNSMMAKGLLAAKVAPSYFIEGMLYNVPNDKFVGSYQDMWVRCFNWVVTADPYQLTTASGLHWLIRDDSPVCWPSANFRNFTAALKYHWESS